MSRYSKFRMNTLNIGILAHVDAGKTSLTERLLFDAGVIDALGSVDKGNTQTDTLALERQRGITIKAAVVSFTVDDLKINLIDTPGHSDFVAEVERVLDILDAVILVISAVEGIQSQTRVLMNTLKKLRIPTLIFINKIDRMGARDAAIIAEIREKLFPQIVIMNAVTTIGSRGANVSLVSNRQFSREKLSGQISRMDLCPVIFGSALTGVGVQHLLDALKTYVVSNNQRSHDSLSAGIFKIERGPRGEKIAYLRLFSGELHIRSRVDIHRINHDGDEEVITEKITEMQLFQNGKTIQVQSAREGEIVKIWGFGDARINDYLGKQHAKTTAAFFSRPSLEVVIVPENPIERSKLYAALILIREQDPLIQVRQDDKGVLSIRLYGEVQQEIIKGLLQNEYDIAVHFKPTQTLFIEKPTGRGTAYANKLDPDNFFEATLRLQVAPAPQNSGVIFKPGPGTGGLPTAFIKAVADTVYKTLQQGLYGWEVTDCIVEITEVGYWDAISTGSDFRGLTPLLLMEALQKAGTEVYEPMNSFELTIPEATIAQVTQNLAHAKAQIDDIATEQGYSRISGTIPVQQTFGLERKIPHLTQGEGIFTATSGEYQKVKGRAPSQPRKDHNPLNKEEYLRKTLKRG